MNHTQFSEFFRIRVLDNAEDDNRNPTLLHKIEDDSITYGRLYSIDGSRLEIQIVDNGTTTSVHTNTGVMNVQDDDDDPYDIWITYNHTGNAVVCNVNNSDKTLSSMSAINWDSDPTDHNLSIGRRGSGTDEDEDGGHAKIDLYDYKYYDNRLVNSTQMGYHWANKWSISNITFGHVLIGNYWATYSGSGGVDTEVQENISYDPTSYYST